MRAVLIDGCDSMIEAQITRQILVYLRGLSGCHVVKIHGSPYQVGVLDIIGCLGGRALAIEVKRPGGRLTARQAAEIEAWRAAGAIAGVATSVEEVKKILEAGND